MEWEESERLVVIYMLRVAFVSWAKIERGQQGAGQRLSKSKAGQASKQNTLILNVYFIAHK